VSISCGFEYIYQFVIMCVCLSLLLSIILVFRNLLTVASFYYLFLLWDIYIVMFQNWIVVKFVGELTWIYAYICISTRNNPFIQTKCQIGCRKWSFCKDSYSDREVLKDLQHWTTRFTRAWYNNNQGGEFMQIFHLLIEYVYLKTLKNVKM
jgi:hypothetical protein